MDNNYYDNNNFDIDKFNKMFKENQDKKDEKESKNKIEYLKSLENKTEVRSISELTINEIIYNFKNENLDLIYDIFTFNYSSVSEFYGIFSKNNRLFYFGLLLLIICVVFYLFVLVFSESYDSNINVNIPKDYNFNYKQNSNELDKLKKDFIELNKKLNNINLTPKIVEKPKLTEKVKPIPLDKKIKK